MGQNNRFYKNGFFKLLQTLTPIIIVIGAIGSVVLVSLAGQRSNQHFLQLLFDIWVLSPFGIIILIKKFSKEWPTITQSMLNCMILFITVSSLIVYIIVNINPSTQLAFPFVIIPLLSWLMILIIILIAKLITRKISNEKEAL